MLIDGNWRQSSYLAKQDLYSYFFTYKRVFRNCGGCVEKQWSHSQQILAVCFSNMAAGCQDTDQCKLFAVFCKSVLQTPRTQVRCHIGMMDYFSINHTAVVRITSESNAWSVLCTELASIKLVNYKVQSCISLQQFWHHWPHIHVLQACTDGEEIAGPSRCLCTTCQRQLFQHDHEKFKLELSRHFFAKHQILVVPGKDGNSTQCCAQPPT